MRRKSVSILIIPLLVATSCIKKKVVPVVIKPKLPNVVITTNGNQPQPSQPQPVPQPAPQAQPVAPIMSGNVILAQMAPVVFSYSLGVGGYWIWSKDFKPGEWVKFLVTTDNGDAFDLEIAFLKKTEDGNEWWRVSYKPKKPGELYVVYEALFSSDFGELKRLRGKVNDNPPQEIPVTQGSYIARPVKLTKESIEGATIGVEVVKVPAGTFRAKHIKYGSFSGKGSVEWWIDSGVPGGVVRYLIKDDRGKVVLTSDLATFGSGASSLLGSF